MVLSNRQFIAGDFGRLDLNPQTTLTAGNTLAWSFNTMPLTLSVQAVTQRPEYAGQAGSAWQLTLYTSAGAAQAVFYRWYAERGGDPAASCRRNYTLAYETDAPAALLAELTDTVAAAGTEGGRLSAYPVNNAAEAAAYRSMLLVLRILAYGFVALIALLGTANIANTVSTGLTLRGRELAMLRSVGMEPADLRRMVLLQSLLYALQALAWGLPLAFVCLLAEYRLLRTAWAFSFTLPWAAILAVAAGLTGRPAGPAAAGPPGHPHRAAAGGVTPARNDRAAPAARPRRIRAPQAPTGSSARSGRFFRRNLQSFPVDFVSKRLASGQKLCYTLTH